MEKLKDDDVIYVGKKHLLNYVTAVNIIFQKFDEIRIVARGQFISKAVDLVEVMRNKFLKGQIEIKSINIGSEKFEKEEKTITISSIEIILNKIKNKKIYK